MTPMIEATEGVIDVTKERLRRTASTANGRSRSDFVAVRSARLTLVELWRRAATRRERGVQAAHKTFTSRSHYGAESACNFQDICPSIQGTGAEGPQDRKGDSTMLERVARWCYMHRWRTLVIWIFALVAAGFLGSKLGGDYSTDFSLPGAESQKAFDLLKDRFPQRSGDTSQVVFKADAGVASVRPRMEALFAAIEKLRHVDSVTSPYSPQGARQVSPGGKIAFADIQFDVRANDVPKAVSDRIIALGEGTGGRGLQVEFGGAGIEKSG